MVYQTENKSSADILSPCPCASYAQLQQSYLKLLNLIMVGNCSSGLSPNYDMKPTHSSYGWYIELRLLHLNWASMCFDYLLFSPRSQVMTNMKADTEVIKKTVPIYIIHIMCPCQIFMEEYTTEMHNNILQTLKISVVNHSSSFNISNNKVSLHLLSKGNSLSIYSTVALQSHNSFLWQPGHEATA